MESIEESTWIDLLLRDFLRIHRIITILTSEEGRLAFSTGGAFQKLSALYTAMRIRMDRALEKLSAIEDISVFKEVLKESSISKLRRLDDPKFVEALALGLARESYGDGMHDMVLCADSLAIKHRFVFKDYLGLSDLPDTLNGIRKYFGGDEEELCELVLQEKQTDLDIQALEKAFRKECAKVWHERYEIKDREEHGRIALQVVYKTRSAKIGINGQEVGFLGGDNEKIAIRTLVNLLLEKQLESASLEDIAEAMEPDYDGFSSQQKKKVKKSAGNALDGVQDALAQIGMGDLFVRNARTGIRVNPKFEITFTLQTI